MSKHGNGGPAFPTSDANGYGPRGLSALDYFAGQALAGIVSLFDARPENDGAWSDYLARRSYDIAAAMIRERNRRNEG